MIIPTRPDNCVGCDIPFRGHEESVADHPNTVRHTGKGLCGTCRRRVNAGKLTQVQMAEQAREAEKAQKAGSKIETDRRNTEAFLKRISAKRRQYEQRAKVRMVIR